jgi:hypothetical protein
MNNFVESDSPWPLITAIREDYIPRDTNSFSALTYWANFLLLNPLPQWPQYDETPFSEEHFIRFRV